MHVYSSLCAIQLLFRLFRKPLCAAVAFAGISLYWLGDIFCLWAVLHAFYAHTPPIAPLLVAYATGYALTRRALPLGRAGVVEAILLFALGAVAIQHAPAVLAVGGYRLTTSGCRCFQRSPGSRRSGGSSASDATADRRTPRRTNFAAQTRRPRQFREHLRRVRVIDADTPRAEVRLVSP